MRLRLVFITILLAATSVLASQSGVTYQGRILKPDGSPLAGANVQFRLQIRTPNANDCLMYEELQALDMRHTNGSFSLTMADGSGSRMDSTGLGLDRIFANRGAFTFSASTCTSGTSYTPSDGDGRNLVVLFKDETMGSWEPIPPAKINYVPFAFSSQTVQGFGADSMLRVVNGSGDPIMGLAPLSNAQYTALLALANGSSTAYTKAGELNGSALPAMTSGEVLGWNGTSWVSTAAAPAANSVTTTMLQNSSVTGAKLDPAISISTSGTIASAITTTRDFKIYAASPSNFYVGMLAPALTGSYTLTWPMNAGTSGQVLTTNGSGTLSWTTPSSAGITALIGDVTATGPGSAAATVAAVGGVTAANVATGANAANAAASANTASTIVKRDASGNFTASDITATNVVTNSLKLNNAGSIVNVINPTGASYTLTLPTGTGTTGQVLTTNGSGVTSWTSPATGTGDFKSDGSIPMTGQLQLANIGNPLFNDINQGSVGFWKIQNHTTADFSGAEIRVQNSASTMKIGMTSTGASSFYQGPNVGFIESSSSLLLASKTASSPIVFSNGSATAPTEKMRITSGGNVGIGTTNPLMKLQVMGAINSSTNNQYDGVTVHNGTNFIGALTGTSATNDNGRLELFNGGITQVRLVANGDSYMIGGNVGIGTTSPVTKLDVVGSLRVGDGGETCAAGVAGGVRYNGGNIQFCNGTAWSTLGVAGAGITALTGDVTASGSGSVAATVAQVGGYSAANVAAGATLANAATNLNTASAIVKRDASGNFSAGAVNAGSVVLRDTGSNTATLQAPTTISSSYVLKLPTAAASSNQLLQSDSSGNTSWVSMPTALPPNGAAGGDLSGTYPNPTVATVGAVTAANVASGANLANAATAANTSNAIVKRDGTGNFTANVATVNGVALNNAGSVVNLVNPVGAAYTLTLPTGTGTNGQVLTTNGSGVTSWTSPATGTGDFMKDGSVAMTGPIRAIPGTDAAPGYSFVGDTDTGFSNNNGYIYFDSDGSSTAQISLSGGLEMNVPVKGVASSTAAAPGFAFTGINDKTGLFNPATDVLGVTTAGVERMRVTAAGKVGIGTTSPFASLQIEPPNVVNPSASVYGMYSRTNVANTVAGTQQIYGAQLSAVVNAGDQANGYLIGSRSLGYNGAVGTTTEVAGAWNDGQHVWTGTSTNVYGTKSEASGYGTGTATNLTGVYGHALLFLGNTTNMYGGNFLADLQSVTQTVPNAYGVKSEVSGHSGGVITNGYGVYANVNPNGGTITNRYAIYAADAGNGANFYNFYSQGTNTKNVFEGNVGVGTTSPSAKLDVKGTFAMSGATSGAVKFAVPAAAGTATYTWPAALPASNMVLQSDNTGALSWVAASGGGISALTGDVTASGTGSVAATVAQVGGYSAANVAAGATLANAATNVNTASAIVKRDASGNFSAGAVSVGSNVYRDSGANTATIQAPTTITSSYVLKLPTGLPAGDRLLQTDVLGNLSWIPMPTASGTAGGDLSGTYPNPTVATVGSVTAANVASGANLANAATNANTASAIVKRDASGNFSANVATVNGVALNNAGSIVNVINPSGAAYTLTLPSGTGTNGQVLTTNGSGVTSWTTVSGGGSTIDSLTDAITSASNLYLGSSSGSATTTGTENVAVGITSSVQLTTGSHNSALGYLAGDGITTQSDNTAMGWSALYGLKAGANGNTAFGSRAGFNNSTGIGALNTAIGKDALVMASGAENTAVGYSALDSTSGNYNVGVGESAGSSAAGNYNIAIGFQAYTNSAATGVENIIMGHNTFFNNGSNQTANNNVVIGGQAASNNVVRSAANNVIIGALAAPAISSGASNVLLGKGAGTTLATGSSNILIGTNADTPAANTSNYLNIGNTIFGNTSTGNVGIGTTSPARALHVYGNFGRFEKDDGGAIELSRSDVTTVNNDILGSIRAGTTDGNVYTEVLSAFASETRTATAGGTYLTLNSVPNGTTAAVERLRIQQDGAVGIGTTAPNGKLDVKGSIVMSGATSGYTGFQPAAAAGSTVWTLPAADGTANQVLTTNGSGVLSWSTPSGGGGITALTGDVTASGTGSVAATVANVGGVTAANVAAAANLANAGTSANTNSAIVKRDATGNFSANVVTANGLTLNNGGSLFNIVNPVGGAWTMTVPQTAGTAGQVMTTNGSGVMTWLNPIVNGGQSFGAALNIGSNDNFDVNFKTNNTTKMTLTNSGRLGVGTSAPNQLIDIQATDSDVHMNIQNNSSTTARYPGVLVQNYTGGNGGAPSFTGIASRGNVGAPLPVQQGDTLFALNGLGATNTSYANGTGAFIQMQAAETFSPTALGTNIIMSNVPNGSTTLQTRMFIRQDGNIGIGTTAPTAKLDIFGSDLRVSTNQATGSEGRRGSFIISEPSGGAYANSGASIDSYSSYADQGDLRFATSYGSNRLERMRITGEGNVGIGTTSPTAKLEVRGGAIVGGSDSISGQCVNFQTGNMQVSSYTSTNSIKLGGLVDGGAYSLVLTGYTAGQTLSFTGYTDSGCSTPVTFGVDFGGSSSGVTNTFTAVGNTQVVTFMYSAARGVVYGSAGTNYYR